MIFHGITAIMVLITSAIASALPNEHIEVPPPNPVPEILSGLFDFVVTRFEAQAVVLSDRSYVNFHLTPYPGAAEAHCFALSTSLNHSLASSPQTWCHHGHDDVDDNLEDWTHDHVWFSWTMGFDVDTTDPTADGVFGLDRQTGAYLKVVRQVDAHTRDESVVHFADKYFEVVGEGMFAHQMYMGRENFTMTSFRFEGVDH
ncbi:predicted protein [Chaetomium globosum CBS 148.51]|uniref:Uncharacterized protein n=1 Tax=Chaetomium globosum (strain ATCC 6205 / CBS 148.51 / DSM 1962 / NBRC 6347 / NRRL 1970) TaxID=306901 RepID=Q2HF93_CHAGB|nr:uncharacterized protein CHGG_01111 [Chaetomium globosum CBS 148.51]EAQ92876.1 predicted protein [Chaetomium globosum CBS 148.51]